MGQCFISPPQGRLANFIDNIVIPGPLIHGIVQGSVNEEWMAHLEDLHNKLEFVRQSKLVQVRRRLSEVLCTGDRLMITSAAWQAWGPPGAPASRSCVDCTHALPGLTSKLSYWLYC